LDLRLVAFAKAYVENDDLDGLHQQAIEALEKAES
jgi:hypothetical protein